MIEIELLREFLAYDPETGLLVWRKRDIVHFKAGKQSAEQNAAAWNALYADNPAFTSRHACGYRTGSILSHSYLAHRVAWAIVHAEWPGEIDHINGDRADNRIANLRNVTRQENLRNAKLPVTNTSGRIGVYASGSAKKPFSAGIRVDGKKIHLGHFSTVEEAIAARSKAEITHGFHGNHGRAA